MVEPTDGLDIVDPVADPVAVAKVIARLRDNGLGVSESHTLAPLTTFGIGGPAAAFVLANDLGDLVTALRSYLDESELDEVPLLVMGKGSNMLVSDLGFPGLVVKLGAGFKHMHRDDRLVEAGAGEAMPALAAWAATEGLAGLEFAAGIPASVGGSVRMNAGAHGGTTSSSLVSVDVALPVSGDVVTFRADQLGFGYRCSDLPRGSVVTAARWLLTPDDPATIRERLDELRAWRRATQPLRDRNCGSVFTNPQGDSAGRLIDAAGLKGMRVGGAAVSTKHANFITVAPGTSADDVVELIGVIRDTVRAGGGPLLVPEVRLVGRFQRLSA